MGPQDDRWMERWLPLLRSAAADAPVLELGCDTGGDTAWLLGQGFEVVATDIAGGALRTCAVAAPQALLLQHDLREPMPFADAQFAVVVASLCLHYFDWATTVRAVGEIARCLRPGGLLLCRVNSTRDTAHGAGQGEPVERNFYRLDARYAGFKRFFDARDLDLLFGNGAWDEASRQECTSLRYRAPKIAWELVLRRRGAPSDRG